MALAYLRGGCCCGQVCGLQTTEIEHVPLAISDPGANEQAHEEKAQGMTPADLAEVSTEASSTSRPTSLDGGNSREFAVSFQRGVELGIDVNHRDHQTLLITRVENMGSVAKHNKKCQSSSALWRRGMSLLLEEAGGDAGTADGPQQIAAGDRIIEVNGMRHDVHAMISKIKTEESLKMTVRRLEEIAVSVSIPPHESDVRLNTWLCAEHADGMTLQVTWVHGSLVTSPMALQVGDRIIGLNGISADSMRLSWELEVAKLPTTVVVRRIGR